VRAVLIDDALTATAIFARTRPKIAVWVGAHFAGLLPR
jgi:hypothetical protein